MNPIHPVRACSYALLGAVLSLWGAAYAAAPTTAATRPAALSLNSELAAFVQSSQGRSVVSDFEDASAREDQGTVIPLDQVSARLRDHTRAWVERTVSVDWRPTATELTNGWTAVKNLYLHEQRLEGTVIYLWGGDYLILDYVTNGHHVRVTETGRSLTFLVDLPSGVSTHGVEDVREAVWQLATQMLRIPADMNGKYSTTFRPCGAVYAGVFKTPTYQPRPDDPRAEPVTLYWWDLLAIATDGKQAIISIQEWNGPSRRSGSHGPIRRF